MTKLLYSSETIGCGATLKLDSKETCMVSVARTGVLVKSHRGRIGISFFGSTLYREKNVYKAAETAAALDALFPERAVPVAFRNPILTAFANAIWHCASAAEVIGTLNEAKIKDTAVGDKTPADLLGELGELMETTLLHILIHRDFPLRSIG